MPTSKNSSVEACVPIAHSGASAGKHIVQTHVQLAFAYLYFSRFLKSVNGKLGRGRDAVCSLRFC